jgi:hypothetical protein
MKKRQKTQKGIIEEIEKLTPRTAAMFKNAESIFRQTKGRSMEEIDRLYETLDQWHEKAIAADIEEIFNRDVKPKLLAMGMREAEANRLLKKPITGSKKKR